MRKGISPLIASVLIIAITVSIGVFVTGWTQNLVKSTTTKVGNQTNEAVNCQNAGITINDVFVSGELGASTGSARVNLRNSGFTDLTIISINLLNSTGHTFTNTTPSTPINGFSIGNLVDISFNNVNISTCPNGFSKIIITTSCGATTATYDTSPTCV